MKNLKKFKQGFTIIELLVVISIFGMISTAATASLSLIRSRANEHKAQIDLATLSKAIELLYFDTGQYPYGLSANPCLVDEKNLFLNDKIAGLVDFDGVIFKKEKRWAGPYMNQIPNDPWKKMYKFSANYICNKTIKGCKDNDSAVRAIYSMGLNNLDSTEEERKDDIVLPLCTGNYVASSTPQADSPQADSPDEDLLPVLPTFAMNGLVTPYDFGGNFYHEQEMFYAFDQNSQEFNPMKYYQGRIAGEGSWPYQEYSYDAGGFKVVGKDGSKYFGNSNWIPSPITLTGNNIKAYYHYDTPLYGYYKYNKVDTEYTSSYIHRNGDYHPREYKFSYKDQKSGVAMEGIGGKAYFGNSDWIPSPITLTNNNIKTYYHFANADYGTYKYSDSNIDYTS
ncbi:type II secretion system GspH family protein, partial [Patescibacteria group bacterium]|nr:type II secretion system GspH family protein [Patescibacteria group bacterium]MBU1870549.1 type II secretion system GspH family protein [Patescibacteria group bacterium]